MSNCGNGEKQTRWGRVTMRYPGPRTRPGNVTTFRRQGNKEYVQSEALTDLVLQGPALRSFREAEKATTPRSLRRKGKIRPILITGVGGRDYGLQAALYATDHQRYADPDCSMHVEFLAVDISSNQSFIRRAQIKRALKNRGWYYAVSGESWHASFGFAG